MAKPNDYKNHVFENIDFVVMYYCLTRKQQTNIFQFCLESVNCTNNICFFAFAGQCLHINEIKSWLFVTSEF